MIILMKIWLVYGFEGSNKFFAKVEGDIGTAGLADRNILEDKHQLNSSEMEDDKILFGIKQSSKVFFMGKESNDALQEHQSHS